MKYQVVRIDEDVDFGCEERSADEPVMAVVVLQDENGNESRIRQEDQMLYDRNIEEGDTVILNENGELRKALSGDWTQNCDSKNVDTTKFVNMMQAVKIGKQIDWICPFCGGKVERLEQEGGKTVIGCTSCDMRIQIENETISAFKAERERKHKW